MLESTRSAWMRLAFTNGMVLFNWPRASRTSPRASVAAADALVNVDRAAMANPPTVERVARASCRVRCALTARESAMLLLSTSRRSASYNRRQKMAAAAVAVSRQASDAMWRTRFTSGPDFLARFSVRHNGAEVGASPCVAVEGGGWPFHMASIWNERDDQPVGV